MRVWLWCSWFSSTRAKVTKPKPRRGIFSSRLPCFRRVNLFRGSATSLSGRRPSVLAPYPLRWGTTCTWQSPISTWEHLQLWWDKTCGQKIWGYEYRNSPFHFAAMNLNFWWGKHALWERISRVLLENLIPTPKDTVERREMGIFGGLQRRHLWCQNSNSNLYVGISNKFCLPFENFCPRNMFGVKHRPWSRLGLVQFFETETVLVSEGPIPRWDRDPVSYTHLTLPTKA